MHWWTGCQTCFEKNFTSVKGWNFLTKILQNPLSRQNVSFVVWLLEIKGDKMVIKCLQTCYPKNRAYSISAGDDLSPNCWDWRFHKFQIWSGTFLSLSFHVTAIHSHLWMTIFIHFPFIFMYFKFIFLPIFKYTPCIKHTLKNDGMIKSMVTLINVNWKKKSLCNFISSKWK